VNSLADEVRTGQSELVTDAPYALTNGETELLIDGLDDDVAFTWALIHLGIHESPAAASEAPPPESEAISAAFNSFERLLARDLVKLGRMEWVDPDQRTGSAAPVKHVSEPIQVVRERVERTCRDAKDWSDWAFCCWLVNTEAGNDIARVALANEDA
jgi:hypothetical protein